MKSATLPDGFFLGQVPPNWTEYLQNGTWSDAHNNRVKVRIPGKHSKGPEILDKDLPWAIVSQSTSTGNRNGASSGLSGGEWVIGFYLDEDEQLPVIIQVLGKNEVSGAKIKASENGTTQFRDVSRFASFTAPSTMLKGGPPPKAPAVPDKEDFEKAKQGLSSPEEAAEAKATEEAAEAAEAAEAKAAEASPPPGPQATLPVATDIPQQIPPPATYPPQEVGSKTADGATVSSGIQTKYPGGPRYQTVTSGLGDGAPQTRWIDNPRDPKFDKARASAGRAPRADKTEPDGILW